MKTNFGLPFEWPLKTGFTVFHLANSEKPDEMLQNAAFHQGQQCLLILIGMQEITFVGPVTGYPTFY